MFPGGSLRGVGESNDRAGKADGCGARWLATRKGLLLPPDHSRTTAAGGSCLSSPCTETARPGSSLFSHWRHAPCCIIHAITKLAITYPVLVSTLGYMSGIVPACAAWPPDEGHAARVHGRCAGGRPVRRNDYRFRALLADAMRACHNRLESGRGKPGAPFAGAREWNAHLLVAVTERGHRTPSPPSRPGATGWANRESGLSRGRPHAWRPTRPGLSCRPCRCRRSCCCGAPCKSFPDIPWPASGALPSAARRPRTKWRLR